MPARTGAPSGLKLPWSWDRPLSEPQAMGCHRVRHNIPMLGGPALRVWVSASWLLLIAPMARASWPEKGSSGLPVCTAPGDQEETQIVPDGAGGTIVVWQDSRAGATDVYAQHILASGQLDPVWPGQGLPVCTAPGDQKSLGLVADGAGGALITWCDSRSGSKSQLYAHHFLKSGGLDPAWPHDGRVVTPSGDSQSEPVLLSDGRGGAIVVWQSLRKGVGTDIYAQ